MHKTYKHCDPVHSWYSNTKHHNTITKPLWLREQEAVQRPRLLNRETTDVDCFSFPVKFVKYFCAFTIRETCMSCTSAVWKFHQRFHCWGTKNPNPTAEQLKDREKNGLQIRMLKDLAYYYKCKIDDLKKRMFLKPWDTVFWKCRPWSISCRFESTNSFACPFSPWEFKCLAVVLKKKPTLNSSVTFV